jgi:hypothetical protein
MRRRPKTPQELRADLNIFEAAWKREMAHVMRNAVERMVAGGSGERIPAKYKMKLPRLTRTVLEPSAKSGVLAAPIAAPAGTARVPSRRSTHRKPRPRQEQDPCVRAAENRELRRSLDNALERMRAFRDGRPMPARHEMTFPESTDATAMAQVRSFQDSARSAHERLLNHLREL